MKIKSLLAAVSMAALTAGTASALTIPAGSVIPTGIVPALELQLPGTPALTGNFSFDVMTQTGDYPNGNNLLVTINLPAGLVFASNLSGSAVVPAPNANGVVNGGGTTGANTVTLLVSLDDAYNSNVLGLALPLRLDACPAAGDFVEVLVRTESGTNIEEGRATTANIIAPCASAINGVVTSDAVISDTQILLAPYTSIGEVLGTGPLNATGTLGAINYSIAPLVTKSLSAVTPLVSTDVDAITFDVAFENAASITSVTAGGISGVKTGNVFRFNVTAPGDIATLLDGTADDIVITAVSGTTVIPTQTVSVVNSSVSFRDTNPVGEPDLILSEAGATGGLDTLQRQGRSFGFFDWNSGGDGAGTVSVYRITGLTGPTDFTVELDNSNADGTYAGTVTPDATGEAVLFSTDMGGTLPAGVVRYDALINLETSSITVDVDRLLSKGGIVTNFGDGSNDGAPFAFNNTPNRDSDQLLGTE